MCAVHRLQLSNPPPPLPSDATARPSTYLPPPSSSPQFSACQFRSSQSLSPTGACPLRRNVFGYFPSPQSLNEPESLYHCPSGTSGLVSIQSRNRLRSSTEMLRSRIRSTR